MLPPEIADDLLDQGLLIGKQEGVEEGPALEGFFFQHPLAETVNGVDGGLVEIGDGFVQPRLGPIRAAHPFRQLRQQGVPGLLPGQDRSGPQQEPPDPVPQLFGGRLGIGDHQDFVDRQFLFQQKPQKQAGQGIGLARPGAGLDQVGPGQGGPEQIQRNKSRGGVIRSGHFHSPRGAP